MTRPKSPLIRRPPAPALLLAGAALLLVALPAHAGFGDLMRKAKEKATQAVAPKPATETPAAQRKVVYDDVVLELTNERIERMLAGFKAASDVSAPRPGLVEKLNKVTAETRDVMDKQGNAIAAQREKRSQVEACLHDAYRAAQDRKGESYRARALTDPAMLEKFKRAAMESNAAASRGDSAAQARLQGTLMSEIMLTREDSLKARQTCPPMPPQLAEEERAETLAQQEAELNEQIRQLDERIAQAQANKGGLSEQQWAAALERLRGYPFDRHSKSSKSGSSSSKSGSSSSKSGSSSSGSGSSSSGSGSSSSASEGSGSSSHGAVPGFSEAEVEAIEKHFEQLKALVNG